MLNKLQGYLIIILLTIAFINHNSFSQDTSNVKQCVSYDELFNTLNDGKSGCIIKTSRIEEFSLTERSLISVYLLMAPDTGYKVAIKITGLKKGPQDETSYSAGSMLGYITKGCAKFNDEYSGFVNTSCSFYTNSMEDVKEVVQSGITKSIDEKYVIEGDLVDVYSKMCSKIKPPVIVKKPALYLYPEQTMNIGVNLTVNGAVTFTEPLYNSGWNVTAAPDGKIDNKYDYLFYEAKLNKIELPDEGWVVEYGKLESWFDKTLPLLGLNPKETKQCREYWVNNLKKANYYEIRLLDNNFLNDNMKITITPEPQTIVRLDFYFNPVNEKSFLKEPIIKTNERKGFTVIEWGGINGAEGFVTP